MKKSIIFFVCSLSAILMSLFVIAGCNDDDPEPINPPTLTTLAVTDITETSAKSGGNITDDGGGEITARGVVWNTEVNPTLENHSGVTVDGTGSGIFQSNITGLSAGTTYFVRAYAINEAGVVYGEVQQFTTEEEYFDVTLLFGKWVSDNLFYRYNTNGTGAVWEEPDFSEDEAQSITWELKQSKLTHGYQMEIGGVTIFKEYTITKLTATKLEYKDDSGNQFFFSKVNESL